jgi:hypothetical protein
VQADPGFQAAREQQQAAAAAPAVQQAGGQVAVVVSQTGQQQEQTTQAPNALGSGVGDLAATKSEQIAPTAPQTGGNTNTATPPSTTTSAGTQSTVTGTVNVRFRLP